MKLLTILTADYANIAEGGKVNVMGIFRFIKASSFPARHSQMSLIIKLEAEFGEEGQERALSVKLCDAEGNKIFESVGKINMPKGGVGLRPEVNVIMNIRDLIFPKPGMYDFVVMIDKDFKGSCNLEVVDISKAKE